MKKSEIFFLDHFKAIMCLVSVLVKLLAFAAAVSFCGMVLYGASVLLFGSDTDSFKLSLVVFVNCAAFLVIILMAAHNLLCSYVGMVTRAIGLYMREAAKGDLELAGLIEREGIDGVMAEKLKDIRERRKMTGD